MPRYPQLLLIIIHLPLQIPSKLLVQVPRFGRESNRIVPDQKLGILELTDTGTISACIHEYC